MCPHCLLVALLTFLGGIPLIRYFLQKRRKEAHDHEHRYRLAL